MNESEYYLAFSNAPGVGPIKFEKLRKAFGSAEEAWEAEQTELEQILKPVLTSKFLEFREKFDIENYLKKLKKQKISFVSLIDDKYPALLKEIPNPPIVLFVRGNTGLLKTNSISIVGTRKITVYGATITKMFAADLASSGLTITSGMAIGVDGIAHLSALEVGGSTIAVLGNGVDLPYPRENEHIYRKIVDSGGAIISEFAPGETPSVGSFPSRNRIIAGISLGVLVTEGASDSGSLITANFGLEFNRKVFAVPGPITSQLSAAPLKLIEKGAKLVVTPDDVLREFKIQKSKVKSESQKFANLSKDEMRIVRVLENESLQFDEIVRKLKIDSAKLGTILSFMEVKGLLKNSGGSYSLSN
ncbi:MAG: hypothetical protein ACD_37C00486G0002 [uncultured bacterium]|nr:MAG: hypothetical protein ACD_37C00486G0002 [uncultured bacterium]KKQ58071.1 MAG: transcriptional regulator, MarR family, DNA processing protein [Microgenomates group bacterium GW2011_GWC1_38_14]